MIITKIRLQEQNPMRADNVGSWPLPFIDLFLNPEAGMNGYVLKDAQGLDPPKITAIVMGANADKRDIVFKIGLNSQVGKTNSELRDAAFKFMNRTVQVQFMNESLVVAQTAGYIQQFESAIFTNQPEIQITIECEDGELTSPNSIAIPIVDLSKAKPIIEYPDGTAPTGLDLKFKYVSGSTGSGFSIFGHSKVWSSGPDAIYNVFELVYPFINNDIITLSTHPKNKRLILTRAEVDYDLAGYVNGGAIWPKLFPGVNAFEWTLDDAWVQWISASYVPKYWGV
jgi:hypothetical protein